MSNYPTKWIVYSNQGLQTHVFQTAQKVNTISGNLKDETLYNTMDEALHATTKFYSSICEVSCLISIDKYIFGYI